MHVKFLLLFSALFFIVLNVNAQEIEVQGKITTFNEIPLNKVSLKLKNSEKEHFSDASGGFSFRCDENEKVTVSAKGFVTKKIKISDFADEDSVLVNLRFKNGKKNFEYATGFGYISEQALTYAIEHLDAGPNFSSYSTILDAIQGRVSGVSVSANSITIRGTSTLNNPTPALLVVDGTIVEFPVFVNIPTVEIKSIDVLKGTAASSLYGSRGMGGVVVVKTKSGE